MNSWHAKLLTGVMMHSHVPRGMFSLSYLWFQMPNSSNELARSHHPNSQINAAIPAFTCELICCLMNKLWGHRNGLEQGQSLVREPLTDLKQWGYLTSLDLLPLSNKGIGPHDLFELWIWCPGFLPFLSASLHRFPHCVLPLHLSWLFCTITLRPASVTYRLMYLALTWDVRECEVQVARFGHLLWLFSFSLEPQMHHSKNLMKAVEKHSVINILWIQCWVLDSLQDLQLLRSFIHLLLQVSNVPEALSRSEPPLLTSRVWFPGC